MSSPSTKTSAFARIRTNFITGLFVLFPVLITVWLMSFLFNLLSKLGTPLANWMVDRLKQTASIVAQSLPRGADDSLLVSFLNFLAAVVDHSWFRSSVGVLCVLVIIYLMGWLATKVLGRKLLSIFDALIAKIPLVQTIYGATKQLLSTFQTKPDGVQRVVLINFPSDNMKTVGLVTRTFKDSITGRELAAVYVPTTPNPTSGYLEVVPVEHIINTDWTVNDAMTFIVSGGSVTPQNIYFDQSAPKAQVTSSPDSTDSQNCAN